jgi:hypothetical protein
VHDDEFRIAKGGFDFSESSLFEKGKFDDLGRAAKSVLLTAFPGGLLEEASFEFL